MALWSGGVGMRLAQAGLVWCSSAGRVRASGSQGQVFVGDVCVFSCLAFPTGKTGHFVLRFSNCAFWLFVTRLLFLLCFFWGVWVGGWWVFGGGFQYVLGGCFVHDHCGWNWTHLTEPRYAKACVWCFFFWLCSRSYWSAASSG